MKRHGVVLAANFVLAVVYFWSGKLGLSLALFHASATPVWPPTGIALVALLVGGYRLWPGILVGALAVNLTTPGTLWTAVGIAAGNTLESLAGALLVNRFARGRQAFERARTLIGFVLLAALASTTISATIGVTTLSLGKVGNLAQSNNYGEAWLTWWLGDMVSAIVLAPLLLVWLGSPLPRLDKKKAVEAALLLFSLVLTGEILFRGWLLPWMKEYPLAFLSVPVVLWAAFRFRQHGASLAACVLATIALQATVEGSGPFLLASPNESLLLVQIFVAAITVTALVLAAAVSERTRAEQYLKTQYRVSQVLAQGARLNEAIPKILQSVCETAGWQWGALWRIDETIRELSCVAVWHIAALEVPEFEAASKQRTFAKGIGLPGRIWTTAAPAWITDVTRDSNFPRAPVAAKEGLRGAFGLPILLGGEVLGVIEFFSRTIREPDENFLQMMGALGNQIGQFIEHTRIEENLRVSEARKAAVIESALDAVITIDRRGAILEFNPAAERIFGFSREQAVGQLMVELIIPTSLREAYRRGLAHYLATGEARILGKRLELPALRSDGTEFPVELSITRIPRAGEPLFIGYLRDITERNKAEEFLKKSEASLAKSQEMAHVGSWELNLAKATTSQVPQLHWSDETFRIFGLKPREVDPSSELFYRMVHPEDRQRVRDAFNAAVAERKPYVSEHRIVRPNGEWREVYQRADVICDATTGRPTRVVGTLQDITERKQAEEQSVLLAALVQSSSDAIISKDLASTIMTWNAGAERLFGYSSDEAVGRPIAIIIPLDRMEEERDILERVRRGERVEHYETVRVRKDGILLDMSLTVSPIRDARGNIVGASKICRDITERKHVEEALRTSEERLRLSQQVARVGSFDWNIETGVNVWTAELEAMYGLPPGGFAKSQPAWESLLHPDDRAAAVQKVELAFKTGQLVESEWRVIWPDGSVHWLAGRWQVFKDPQGQPVRMAGVNIDITERKRAEELIQASLNEKEVLLQEIHHRVKNNMQIISSLLQLQSGYLQNPQAVEAFRDSQARIRSMALIHEKLYQSESLAKIDLADYLRSLLGMLFRTYSPRLGVIRLETHIAPALLSLDAAIPIGLVTHELVSNCLKYAFADGRDGVVRVELNMMKAGEYTLTVEDNGVGLPAGFDLEKVSTLGLRLTQMFAKQMHGELTLVRDGPTTRFTVSFGDRIAERTPKK